MGKVLAYLRASTDKQDLNHQRLEILEYARQTHLEVHDFIAISISSLKSPQQRRIHKLSRLGRSTGQVINLIDELVNTDVRIIVLKQKLILDR